MLYLNRVIHGEASKKLKKIPDNVVNLVYLDPPFFSNRKYERISEYNESYSFNDKWKNGISEYVEFMKEIFVECYRTLSKSGSFYLHCDWHASHYLKVELDRLFGYGKFRNEIIWKRHNAHNRTRQGEKTLGRIHDIILLYTKSNKYTWNAIYQSYPHYYVNKYYKYRDTDTGRTYALGDLSGPGGRTKHNPCYEFLGITRYWRYSKKICLGYTRAIGSFKGDRVPFRYSRYLDEMPGTILQDIWDDIPSELTGRRQIDYPTQKPLKLLERIIELSTNPKDIVLDPFCGSGTTLCAARSLDRNFIGIDINEHACNISRGRLKRNTHARKTIAHIPTTKPTTMEPEIAYVNPIVRQRCF